MDWDRRYRVLCSLVPNVYSLPRIVCAAKNHKLPRNKSKLRLVQNAVGLRLLECVSGGAGHRSWCDCKLVAIHVSGGYKSRCKPVDLLLPCEVLQTDCLVRALHLSRLLFYCDCGHVQPGDGW